MIFVLASQFIVSSTYPFTVFRHPFWTNSVLRVACECESSSTGTFNKDCDYETSGFVASSNRYTHDMWDLTDTPMICVVVRGCGDGGNTLHGDWPESGGGSSVMWSCSASGHPGPHTAASHTGWGEQTCRPCLTWWPEWRIKYSQKAQLQCCI